MNVWGRGSQRNLSSVRAELQDIADAVLQIRDHSVIEGHRDEATQNRYYEEGVSKLQYPDSKHNAYPSNAIDIQPYPYPATEQALREDLTLLAGLYIGVAAERGLVLRWGGDWDRDGETGDNNFDDLFHIEIV